MKKIIISLAVLLLGTASVFASPYEVIVSWDYLTPFYCQSQLSNEYEFKVNLIIYDIVNDGEVANITHTIDWDETGTIFNENETGIEDWCENATSTPNFKVFVSVKMEHKTDPDPAYCEVDDAQDKTCYQFSNLAAVFSFVFQ
ncbi:MAG: hypothetical protein DRI89_12730 [Bacteroidetes bacterium]|nr:MAG: hypothetical protein DRI89_12730 [Bacteroidota bacterium]